MIIGKQNPVVGVEEYYQINDFQIGSLLNHDVQYLWYLWRKQKNGTWLNITKKEGPKKGPNVSYKFGETFLGIQFKIQVYKATKNVLTQKLDKKLFGELSIVPASSKTPKIERVVLFNGAGSDVNKAHYSDTLTARAYCTAMFNQTVEFHLWEDDAPKGGHNPTINQHNRCNVPFPAKVNEKGIAEVEIKLLSHERILKSIANRYTMEGDNDEGKNHEFYVTASYYGKVQGASQVNVDVANPDYKPKSQNPPAKKPSTQPSSSKSKPKQNTPNFPATAKSTAPKKADPQNKIIDAYFVNIDGHKLSRIIVGDKDKVRVKVRIASNGMKDKKIQYVIWEYDVGSHDEIYRSGEIKLGYDLADMPEIIIDQDRFKKGIDFRYGDSDNDYQNYFIEVIPLDVSAGSKTFGVTSEGLMKVEKTKSTAKVKEEKVEIKYNKGNCIPCQIGLTVQDLDKFMTASSHGSISNVAPYNTRIPAYISYLNQYMTEFEINKNCYRIANFLGQVAKETKFWSYKEDFEHSVSSLKSNFKNFKTEEGKRYADEFGYKNNKSEITNEVKIKIANYAYARNPKRSELGNNECPINKLSDPEQDGYKYRGRGLIQLTGRSNYSKFQEWYNNNRNKLGLPEVNFLSNPDLVFEPQYIVLSAIYFWNANGLNSKADAGIQEKNVLAITNVINSGEDQAKKTIRYDYVKSAHSMLSEKAKDCPLKTNYKTPSGKWHDPVDNPICTLYMQSGGGGEAGKHWGLFGQTRNGSDHVGLDLFATKGTSIYACVDGTIYNRRWHGGYGNTITIKVKNPKEFMKFKKNYKLQFGHKGEIASGGSWSENGDIYLFYGHLDSVKEYEFGQEVKCGEVLGTTGRSGVEKGTCAPHLHFEVLSDYVMGSGSIRTRINPAFFVDYKGFSEQTNAEKKKQEDEKNSGKIVQFEGVKKLAYADIKGFIK